MIKFFLDNRLLLVFILPFFLGCLSVFSFQPFNLTLINFFVFPLIFYLIVFINKKSKVVYRKKPHKKNLFIFGLLFGFGFYLSGISWIINSLTFDENYVTVMNDQAKVDYYFSSPEILTSPEKELNMPDEDEIGRINFIIFL